MTCMEKLLSAVERENKGDGTTPERWRTVLLTSIADSLAVIADKLIEEKNDKQKMYQEIEEIVRKYGYEMTSFTNDDYCLSPYDRILCIYDSAQMAMSEGIPLSVCLFAKDTGISIGECFDLFHEQREKAGLPCLGGKNYVRNSNLYGGR